MADAQRLRPLLGSILFFVVAPGFFAVFIPWYTTGWTIGPPLLGLEPLRWIGAALIGLGAVILLDTFTRFAFEGRGTPAPAFPTVTLVVSGPYRYVRNPMYLAVSALIVGQALLIGCVPLLLYGLGFWAATHLFVLFYEEPVLRRRYGARYEAYAAHVRRWRPRLTPWQGGAD